MLFFSHNFMDLLVEKSVASVPTHFLTQRNPKHMSNIGFIRFELKCKNKIIKNKLPYFVSHFIELKRYFSLLIYTYHFV